MGSRPICSRACAHSPSHCFVGTPPLTRFRIKLNNNCHFSESASVQPMPEHRSIKAVKEKMSVAIDHICAVCCRKCNSTPNSGIPRLSFKASWFNFCLRLEKFFCNKLVCHFFTVWVQIEFGAHRHLTRAIKPRARNIFEKGVIACLARGSNCHAFPPC